MKFSINTHTLYQAKETNYNSEAKKAAIFIDEFIKRYIENPLESFNINVYHDHIINYRIGMAVKFENERTLGVYLYDILLSKSFFFCYFLIILILIN